VKVLGAVLAGGKSSRFGSDKGLALLNGTPLIDYARTLVAAQCDGVVTVGRGEVRDWPEAGRGPLGGLAGALLHAEQEGFDAVLSCALDSLGLPPDLRERLTPPPSYVRSQPVIGLWPTGSLEDAQAILSSGASASMRGFAERIGARAVKLPSEPANVNTPADLARWELSHGV
jgi:molybdopterin-guanine dinucleotide biosynthesis protein A